MESKKDWMITLPNTNWNQLTPLQLGRYAEYFAKMEFASYGLEVYTSEVDDHGIDFIVKDKQGSFAEIQVKSLRGMGYVFMSKSKFDIRNRSLYLALLIFNPGQLPDIFLIPASTWQKPDEIFVDRDYDKEGQISKPEYGVNISRKNYPELERFRFEIVIKTLM
jgi:hypothetical protein